MEKIDYWKFHSHYTVMDAAILIAGKDPADFRGRIESMMPTPDGYEASFSGLKWAIMNGELRAIIRKSARELLYYEGYQGNPGDWEEPGEGEIVEKDDSGRRIVCQPEPDWGMTTIARKDLTAWLVDRNFKPAFFFEQTESAPDYLDPKHQNYSPKLAAAIKAWEAVATDEKYLNNGKSPKTNLENWLLSHAAEYNLVKGDGNINRDAITNQVAKVANWDMGGGAPTTPSNNPPTHKTPIK